MNLVDLKAAMNVRVARWHSEQQPNLLSYHRLMSKGCYETLSSRLYILSAPLNVLRLKIVNMAWAAPQPASLTVVVAHYLLEDVTVRNSLPSDTDCHYGHSGSQAPRLGRALLSRRC